MNDGGGLFGSLAAAASRLWSESEIHGRRKGGLSLYKLNFKFEVLERRALSKNLPLIK